MRFIFAAALFAALVPAISHAKTLRVAVNTWPPAMGNPYGQQIQGAVHPFPGIFDALTFMESSGVTSPNLALSWSNDGANTWTFKLRPNVKFINGEPFNAASVVAVIDWLKKPDSQRYFYAAEVKNIASARATDDLTVVFTTTTPDVILPKRLSLLPIVPPKLWAEQGVEAFSQKPRGTGPFLVESFGRDRGYYAIEGRPGSWRPTQHLTRIEFRVLPDQAARLQALKTGKVDIVYGIGFEDFDDLRADGFEIGINAIATTTAIALSNRNPKSPLVDKRVRQALNYAVNRDAIGKVIFRDTVKPTASGIERGVFGFDPNIKGYSYDPAKARALLAEAGHAKGFKIRANVLAAGASDMTSVYQQVAQDLAAVGITMELNAALGTDWVQMWSSGDWRGADVLSSSFNGSTYMDAGRAVESYTCIRPQPFFCAPDVEAIFAKTNTEFDEKKREALLQQAVGLLHDLAPAIYLFPQAELMAMSPKVKNVTYRGRFVDWTTLDIAN